MSCSGIGVTGGGCSGAGVGPDLLLSPAVVAACAAAAMGIWASVAGVSAMETMNATAAKTKAAPRRSGIVCAVMKPDDPTTRGTVSNAWYAGLPARSIS